MLVHAGRYSCTLPGDQEFFIVLWRWRILSHPHSKKLLTGSPRKVLINNIQDRDEAVLLIFLVGYFEFRDRFAFRCLRFHAVCFGSLDVKLFHAFLAGGSLKIQARHETQRGMNKEWEDFFLMVDDTLLSWEDDVTRGTSNGHGRAQIPLNRTHDRKTWDASMSGTVWDDAASGLVVACEGKGAVSGDTCSAVSRNFTNGGIDLDFSARKPRLDRIVFNYCLIQKIASTSDYLDNPCRVGEDPIS
ncbi:hypothetical protein NC652_004907 [Populus alba x Populus x berolinensis]|nr:hypothetical protein NC652_004907 [Populus alba x Populus x berolinensis]